MPDASPILPPAPWAVAVESVEEDLRDALAGEIVLVRLPMDGIASVMVADGRGGSTQRKLWTPVDIAWLVNEHAWAAAALTRMIETRQAQIASGEYAWRMAVIERQRAAIMFEDAQNYLRNFMIPDTQLMGWVADAAARRLKNAAANAWETITDPVWTFVLGLRDAAANAVAKVGRGFKYLGFGLGALVALWAVGTAARPWRT